MKGSFFLDIDICSGCGACTVACMDQNDINLVEGPAFRRIYRVEREDDSSVKIRYISMACLHCEDSPCAVACPTGAIVKDDLTGAVLVNEDLCIGCHSCALACPFGVPRYSQDSKLQKCNLCVERVEYGLEPACVRTCPVKALTFQPANDAMESKENKYIGKIVSSL